MAGLGFSKDTVLRDTESAPELWQNSEPCQVPTTNKPDRCRTKKNIRLTNCLPAACAMPNKCHPPVSGASCSGAPRRKEPASPPSGFMPWPLRCCCWRVVSFGWILESPCRTRWQQNPADSRPPKTVLRNGRTSQPEKRKPCVTRKQTTPKQPVKDSQRQATVN